MEPDIVIIGAGAAGTGAARQLAAAGHTPLILEALPRPGGRAHTALETGFAIDMGCGYLHSADRNPWTEIADQSGVAVERREPAWDRQYRSLGAAAAQWRAAHDAFEAWSERLRQNPPASDIAAEALDPTCPYNPHIQAMSGYISGDELERISATDYLAYDNASTYRNWRLPGGYGALITGSLPPSTDLRLNTPLQKLTLTPKGVALETPSGTLRPRAVILTVSTAILTGENIAWDPALTPWREAAKNLPLGQDEKLFLEILGDSHPFAPETHVTGSLTDATTGSFYIRPFGRPIIECFLGGQGARNFAAQPLEAAFDHAITQLANLFGNAIRPALRPLIASNWTNTPQIGGGYSHALPGQSAARVQLATPCENRIFFAGEATHRTDFSTAHGAYLSGLRAASEAMAIS